MFVDEFGLAQFAQKNADAAAAADIGLERGDLGRVEPLEIQEKDGVEAVERMIAQEARRLDQRADAAFDLATGGQGGRQEQGIAGPRIAIDDQHRRRGRHLDHRVAHVVGGDGVAFQLGRNVVLAGRGEDDRKPAGDAFAGRDLLDDHRRSGQTVFGQRHRNVVGGAGGVVRHGHVHPQRHARGANAGGDPQIGNRQIRVRAHRRNRPVAAGLLAAGAGPASCGPSAGSSH